MTIYYNLIGTLNGIDELLYGSFIKDECKEELAAERVAFKEEGFKKLRIVAVPTVDDPDAEVYQDELVSKRVYEDLSGEDAEQAIEDGILVKSNKAGYYVLTDNSFLNLSSDQARQEVEARGLCFNDFKNEVGTKAYYSEVCLRNWLGY